MDDERQDNSVEPDFTSSQSSHRDDMDGGSSYARTGPSTPNCVPHRDLMSMYANSPVSSSQSTPSSRIPDDQEILNMSIVSSV